MSHYDRLSALDNSFLLFEKPNAYTHVASTQIFDAGSLRLEDGGIDFDAIRKAHAAILHRIPRYRQVLKWVPFTNQPVWVDDPHFDLDFHLRHTSLPQPGSERQLKRLSARVMQQHVDRARPLWETWVVEGLEGDRFALISKVHHCMIDGVSGVDIMQLLMSRNPEVDLPTPPAFVPRPAPSGGQLLRDEILRTLTLPLEAVRDFRKFAEGAEDVQRELKARLRAVASTVGATLASASETPINAPIGPHRRFDWLRTPISEIKQVRKNLGGSLNDVVLTAVTGAFRRFLSDRGVDLTELDFRVMTPVSVRSESERGTLGNRVSTWIFQLPLGKPDPRDQLAEISRTTAELKESRQAIGADVLLQAAEWTPTTLLSLGARNATRMTPFNTVVTNVPGPQHAMYMLGARLLEVYPHVPLVDNLGLGIALMSYDGQMHWGVNADRDLVPDLHPFIEALEISFAELRRLASEA
jgi:WS/DGAT/MGAT family acyltransferase